MEKPGNEKSRGRYAGLLRAGAALLLALSSVPSLGALSVSVDSGPVEARPGSNFTLTVTAYGAELADTSLVYGSVPEGLTLVGSRKEAARLAPKDGQTLTALASVVFTLTLRANVPGTWELGPFEIRSGGETYRAAAASFIVRGDPYGDDPDAAVAWAVEGSGTIRAGRARTIALTGPAALLGATVSCPAPENAILEPLPAGDPGTGGRVILARYRWTPLESGEQGLPRAVVSGLPGGRSLASAEASVRVSGAAPGGNGEASYPELDSAFTPVAPDSSAETAAGTGAGAEAVARLVGLRASEYRSFFPAAIRAQRLALEGEMGLEDTLPVPPAAWKFPAVFGAAIFLALAFLFSLLASRIRLLSGMALALGIGAFSLAFFAVSLYIRDSRPAGVADGGPLYNVPDPGSRTLETLPDGTSLLELRVAGGWVYGESAGGARGWIPASRFHLYTATETESE